MCFLSASKQVSYMPPTNPTATLAPPEQNLGTPTEQKGSEVCSHSAMEQKLKGNHRNIYRKRLAQLRSKSSPN